MEEMFFLNQTAEYLYIAYQSAGNSLIFQAAASQAPSVLWCDTDAKTGVSVRSHRIV